MYPKVERHEENTSFHFDNLFLSPPSFDSIILHQIGDIGCQKGYRIGEHIQYCYEISYIVSGSGIYFIDEQAYSLQKGDIIICRPGERHDGLADNADPFRVLYTGFNFHQSPAEEEQSFIRIKNCLDTLQSPVIHEQIGIEKPFQNILYELLNPDEDSHFVIRINLFQLLMSFYRNVSGHVSAYHKPHTSISEKKRAVYGVVNYIDKHLYELKELTQIASKLGYSYTYLSHIFPQEMGVTIQEYYKKKRFDYAIKLLEESELTITEIAEKLGYQSVHSFSQAFRKVFGVSPSIYQQTYPREGN